MKAASWLFLPLAIVVAGCGGSSVGTPGSGASFAGRAAQPEERQEAVLDATTALASDESKAGINGVSSLGFRLLQELKGPNPLVSPLSVHTALAMTLNGADGETASQMRAVLGGDSLTPAQLNALHSQLRRLLANVELTGSLKGSNALWVRQGIKLQPGFREPVQSFFNAKLSELDFASPQAPKTINDWVKANTEGMIPTLVEELQPSEAMLLTNALYFKARWQDPFEPEATKPMPFTPAGPKDAEPVTVPMMSQTDTYAYGEKDGRQILIKPYLGGGLEMVFVLEPAQKQEGASALDAAAWRELIASVGTHQVDVRIPRFKAGMSQDVKSALAALGMAQAFEMGKADFSRMFEVAPGTPVAISRVIHQTLIEVNEEGAEAAAATGIGMEVGSAPMPEEPKKFHADRPFFYAIREPQTGLLLFLGRLDRP